MTIRLLHIIITLLLATTPLLCSAQGLTEAQQRQRLDQYKRELDRVKGEVETLKREKSSASQQVAALDREMRMRNDYISEIEAERRGVEAEIEAMDRSIDSLTGVLEHNRAMYAEAVRIAHRNYRQHSRTNYLFSSSSLHEAARRMAEIEHIAVSREHLATSKIGRAHV